MPPLTTLRPAEAIGSHWGLGCGPSCDAIEIPRYAVRAHHRQFADAYEASGMYLHEAATALGISAVDVSGLRRGNRELDSSEWESLITWMQSQKVR